MIAAGTGRVAHAWHSSAIPLPSPRQRLVAEAHRRARGTARQDCDADAVHVQDTAARVCEQDREQNHLAARGANLMIA
eukprot:scaffold5772_cov105-Isochrysis_galbana.AAC.5